MAELSGLSVFKYLPAAKKAEHTNCKECGFATCMAYALKLAKGAADINACKYMDDDLRKTFARDMAKPQKEVMLGINKKVKAGGEEVLFRHDKTLLTPTVLCVEVDTNNNDFNEKIKRILDYKISRINKVFKIDAIYLKGKNFNDSLISEIENEDISVITELPNTLMQVEDENFKHTVEKLTLIRRSAIETKDEEFSSPTFVYLKHTDNIKKLCAKAGYYICKYANMLIFEDFDETMFSTLLTLRESIFTDPQKPMQIEPKVYSFNNPDENAIIFLTTNFALTYFAVAGELEALDIGTYLIVTPSDGMSVLTAWSAEKITAQIAAKAVEQSELYDKVKYKKIYIPGLLANMQEELQNAIPDFEICLGTTEAYMIKDFVKEILKSRQ